MRALEAGADDYVTKPFGPRELVARLQAALRRAGARRRRACGPRRRPRGRPGGAGVRRRRRRGPPDADRVRAAGRPRQPGRLLTHRQLLTAVWGGAYARGRRGPAHPCRQPAPEDRCAAHPDGPGRGVPVRGSRGGLSGAARGRLRRRFLELLARRRLVLGDHRALARRVEHVVLEPRVAALEHLCAALYCASSSLDHSSPKSRSARRRAWRANSSASSRASRRARAARGDRLGVDARARDRVELGADVDDAAEQRCRAAPAPPGSAP